MFIRISMMWALCFLLFSCAHKTVKSISYGEKVYIQASPSEAECVVTLKYAIPGVVNDTDTFYFKTYRSEFITYSDGSMKGTRPGPGRRNAGKYRDGKGYCNSHSSAKGTKDGVEIDLSIKWGKEPSGNVKKTLVIPWTDLPKEIKDDSNNLKILVKREELRSKDEE